MIRPDAGAVLLHDPVLKCWRYFSSPVSIIQTEGPGEVSGCLRAVDTAIGRDRHYAAGFIAYEAAPSLDPSLSAHDSPPGFPLIWFGLFEREERIVLPVQGPYRANPDWTASVSREAYGGALAAIKEHIAAGDTYQVNYTYRLSSDFNENPWELFLRLAGGDAPGYAAYINTGRFIFCSASPELFFDLENGRIACRPMKGTAKRGRTTAEDALQHDWLIGSEKNRAENVMIVDMIRNDLGRIARTGSVRVERLFDIERYPTVWQMTSTISAKTAAPFSEIVRALFPCASVTGAPKTKTMEIIRELETRPRGIYTGAIGFCAPEGRACFSVAIRTVCIDTKHRRAEYGVGGGILYESDITEEYEECQAKSSVLVRPFQPFGLLESLLWMQDAGYALLEFHLDRLADSARYFGFPCEKSVVRDRLFAESRTIGERHAKVRLVLDRSGEISIEWAAIPPPDPASVVRLRLAVFPVDSTDVFLFHKTTNRAVYENARNKCADCDDVLLINERGEVTETSAANIAVEIDGGTVTPPVQCGLLAGTFRRDLLEKGELVERLIFPEDLARADKIWVMNSVRGKRKAVLLT